jgi:hypothetical protein
MALISTLYGIYAIYRNLTRSCPLIELKRLPVICAIQLGFGRIRRFPGILFLSDPKFEKTEHEMNFASKRETPSHPFFAFFRRLSNSDLWAMCLPVMPIARVSTASLAPNILRDLHHVDPQQEETVPNSRCMHTDLVCSSLCDHSLAAHRVPSPECE